ncbi:MAG: PQQ-binding-like beta-propeller repeat protein [Myxococcales bacterium]|nr:PQQ-binding-like beta-propeller repeat protein [Myxococcales bacterium]
MDTRVTGFDPPPGGPLALGLRLVAPRPGAGALTARLGDAIVETDPLPLARLRRRLVAGLQAVLEHHGHATLPPRFALDARGRRTLRLSRRGAAWSLAVVDRTGHAVEPAITATLGQIAEAIEAWLARLGGAGPLRRRAVRLAAWAAALDAGRVVLDATPLGAGAPPQAGPPAEVEPLPVAALRHLAYRRVWRREAPGLGAVAQAGDQLLVHDADGLRALDRRTGDARWRRPDLHPAPAPAGYALDADGRLVAYAPATGDVRWRAPLPSAGLHRVVEVDERVLLVGHDHRVHARDARDGAARWRFATFHGAVTACVGAGPRLWLTGEDGFVHGLGARDGQPRFRAPLGGEPAGPPRPTARGLLLLRHDSGALTDSALLLDPDTGAPRWTRALAGAAAAVAVDDDHAYVVVDEGLDGWLCALDLSDGALRWRAALEPVGVRPRLTLHRDAIYLKLTDGRVQAHARADGRLRWSAPADDDDLALTANAPIVACRGLLLAPGTAVRALDPRDGRVVHTLDCGELVPRWMHVWPEGDVAIAEDDAVALYLLGGHLALVA